MALCGQCVGKVNKYVYIPVIMQYIHVDEVTVAKRYDGLATIWNMLSHSLYVNQKRTCSSIVLSKDYQIFTSLSFSE